MSRRRSARAIEWVVTLGLSLFVFAAYAIAKIQRSMLALDELHPPIQVFVQVNGAIKNPGLYAIERGRPLSLVMEDAKPLGFADLSPLDLKAPVLSDASINVLELEKFTIYLSGAIETVGAYEVPKNCRICDLKKWAPLLSQVDSKFLKKRNKIKNGETIEIPFEKNN